MDNTKLFFTILSTILKNERNKSILNTQKKKKKKKLKKMSKRMSSYQKAKYSIFIKIIQSPSTNRQLLFYDESLLHNFSY